jgi:hypothetical protein
MPNGLLMLADATRMAPSRGLRLSGACQEGVAWASAYSTAAAAWDACPNPDWLIWILDVFGIFDDSLARLFACRCVRHTPLVDENVAWHLLHDQRSRTAVEVAEGHARGLATDKEMETAWLAAIRVLLPEWSLETPPSSTWSVLTQTIMTWSTANEGDWACSLGAAAAAAASSREAALIASHWTAVSAGIDQMKAASAQAGYLRELFGNPFACPEEYGNSYVFIRDSEAPQ